MKKIIKKITAMAVMSLFAATQLQTPQEIGRAHV